MFTVASSCLRGSGASGGFVHVVSMLSAGLCEGLVVMLGFCSRKMPVQISFGTLGPESLEL